MNGVNRQILVGNVGKEPSVGSVGQNNSTVINFSLAVTDSYKDRNGDWQENTTWFNIVAWRKLAEAMGKHVHKGTKLYIEGKTINRSYDDRDGNKRYITEVEVKEFEVLVNAPNQGQQAHSQGHSQQPQKPHQAPVQQNQTHEHQTAAGDGYGYNGQDDGRPF